MEKDCHFVWMWLQVGQKGIITDMENGQAIGGFGTVLEPGNHTTEMTTKLLHWRPMEIRTFGQTNRGIFFGQISVSYEHRKEQWIGACVSRIWNF